MDTLFQSPFGSFQLRRYPVRKKETLRAWDSADEYVLQYLEENKLLQEDTSLLIINDSFGGLSIPLNEFLPVVVSDSYLSMQAILLNAKNNGIDESEITIIDSLLTPESILNIRSDIGNHIVLIKLPKSLAMLEDQLHRIRPLLGEQTVIIAAAMTKHIHMSTLELFEKIIGPTKSSLAKKKSRLIFSQFDASLTVADNPYPKSYALPYKLDDVDIEIKNHAAVFSQEKLDPGARFFIENIPVDEKYKIIVDLGCGNGLVGLMAAIKNPSAKIIFTDESYMAVESSISNFLSVFDDTREAEFLQTDCLQGVEEGSVSLILCNPPFHQNHAINDNVAWQMFSESRQTLVNNGELWVIGNRHLAYHAKLKKIFGNSEVVASNKKFVIVKAIKK
ncbi:MAG: methyltransferase [Gammaproteobacteria bacterium]|nr:MAG: methyltransferase [Gammaproteobacteria bacterium]